MEEANYNEVILTDEGRLFKRTVIQREVLVSEEQVLAGLKEGQRNIIRDAMLVGKFPTSLSVTSDKNGVTLVDATIRLPYLRFNTNFHTVEGASCPTFQNPVASEPRFNVEWNINDATQGKVKLWFLVKTNHLGEGLHTAVNCYIVATSATNRTYRMPLANVYDECRVCMGEYGKVKPSLYEVLESSLDQFFASPWNADLIKSREKSDAFFRFKPENDGFKTLPVQGQWNNLCERVSYPQLETLVLPPAEGSAE